MKLKIIELLSNLKNRERKFSYGRNKLYRICNESTGFGQRGPEGLFAHEVSATGPLGVEDHKQIMR